MQIDTNTLLQIIGELEVVKRLHLSEIATLQQKLAEIQAPTPIKPEMAVNDDG